MSFCNWATLPESMRLDPPPIGHELAVGRLLLAPIVLQLLAILRDVAGVLLGLLATPVVSTMTDFRPRLHAATDKGVPVAGFAVAVEPLLRGGDPWLSWRWSRCSWRSSEAEVAGGRTRSDSPILAKGTAVLAKLLHVLLQLGRVAGGHVGLDLPPIGIDLLPHLVLLGVVVVQRVAIVGQRAAILLDLAVILLPTGVRRAGRRSRGRLLRRGGCFAAGLPLGLRLIAGIMHVVAQLPLIAVHAVIVVRQLLTLGVGVGAVALQLAAVVVEVRQVPRNWALFRKPGRP